MVTGAGGGIGRETALAFARAGASVALVDLPGAGIQESLALVTQTGARALALPADISDEAQVVATFATAISGFGRLDCAVNNAGVAQVPTLTADMTLGELERLLRINVIGTWLCLREELRHMGQHGGGAIVNTASFAGIRTIKMQTGYVASKHAVVGLTKNAAVEYADQDIRINAVAPGVITTPMMDGNLAGLEEEQRKAALVQIASYHPMNRTGKPSEISDAILFLCSDKAAFITGTCLSVDGGWAAN